MAVIGLRAVKPRVKIGVVSRPRTSTMPRGSLYDTIQRLVAEDKYIVGEHVAERLEERGIFGVAGGRRI